MSDDEEDEKKRAKEEQMEAEAQAQDDDRAARTQDEGLNENSMDIGDDESEDDDSDDSKKRKKKHKDDKEDESGRDDKDNDETKRNAEKDAEEGAEDHKEKAQDDIQDQNESNKGKGENTRDLNPNKNAGKEPTGSEGGKSPEAGSPESPSPEGGSTGQSPETSPPEKMNASDFGNSPGAGAEAGAAESEAGAAGAGGTAAEGATAAEGGATAGGTAAAEGGAVAAEGATTAAGGTAATAGGAAAGGSALAVCGIVALIILIIIIIIGGLGFFTTMPQFLWNRMKELAQSLWDGLQGYVIGIDEATVNKDDIIYTAQYLYDMGYDLVGMGFAESVEIYGQQDKTGKEIPVEDGHTKNEIKKVDAPYLRAYLVAENRTYLINNYTFNLKDFASSFFDGSLFDEGLDTWGTGMIDLDTNLLDRLGMPAWGINIGDINIGELVKGVSVDRASNTMKIRRLNIGWDVWNAHFDYTTFSLEGWTGRYGKPFELLYTLHVATMAPDLVKEFALNDDLDAKVHVKLKDTNFSGTLLVDGRTIDQLEEAQAYSEETIQALRDFEKEKASDIKTSIPYISSVTKHWFRNVYFEGTDSEGADRNTKVGVDEDGDDIEDYNEAVGVKTQKTRNLSASDNVYEFGDTTSEEMPLKEDYTDAFGETAAAELAGTSITLSGDIASGVVQVKDAVRGVTNPTTKKLFSQKYYIYDGTIATAQKIQQARAAKDNSIKEKISFNKDSLQAFTILEESETLDAQYIYRDLKELVIELGYFEREDFAQVEKQVLEWPIPDYIPGEWPNREIEKQVLEYGTLIACDETVADSLGMSVEDLRKMTGTDESDDDNNSQEDDYLKTLKGTLFIGDSYFEGLKNNVNIEDAEFYVKSGTTPAYWLKNIGTLPSSASKICVYLGVNDPDQHQQMKDLIDALRKKYEGTKIYVIEVMHLGSNYNNVDSMNKRIDAFNYQIREKCKTLDTVRFIDASDKLISQGYLKNPDSSGIHMQASDYKTWAENIAYKIKDTRLISRNDTDEEFVAKFLKAAKEITTYVKENNFEYGNAEYMPPKADGTTNDDGSKKISCDRLVSWALYKCGYTDQPENGLCVSANGDFIEYCEDKEWKRINNVDDVQAGDIVFTKQLDSEGKKAGHVFICAGDGLRYDCGSQQRIDAESQPFKESIGSDFMCAYRVTGDGVISTGFQEGLPVVAMGNGKVTEIYNEDNNIFSDAALTKKLYGKNGEKIEDTVEGREQSLEGVRIKLTDKALKGYVLVMYGFKVEGVSKGDKVTVGNQIGTTLNSDICLILIDKDKAVVEDIEEYIKVPKKTKNSSTGIYADLEAIDENSTDAEKVRAIVSYFIEQGFSVEGACGIVGNLIQETNLDPTCVTGSYRGLAQWDAGGRWAKVTEWMASEGYNETSFAGQVRAIYECPSETAQMPDALWEELKGLTDLKKAAELFCVYYERCVHGQDATVWYKPGDLYQDLNKRKQFAQNAYDIYMGDDSKGLKDGA